MHQLSNFTSERLTAAPLIVEDQSVLYQIYSDAEAMKYRGSGPMQSTDDAAQMIQEQSNDTKFRFGLRTKLTNELIGTALVVSDEEHPDRFEIGFSFGKEHWGKGYAQETLAMLERGLSDQHGSISVVAWCVKENVASVCVFEKAGYTQVDQTEYPGSIRFEKRIAG